MSTSTIGVLGSPAIALVSDEPVVWANIPVVTQTSVDQSKVIVQLSLDLTGRENLKMIPTIKAVRELTGMGLRESKALVDYWKDELVSVYMQPVMPLPVETIPVGIYGCACSGDNKTISDYQKPLLGEVTITYTDPNPFNIVEKAFGVSNWDSGCTSSTWKSRSTCPGDIFQFRLKEEFYRYLCLPSGWLRLSGEYDEEDNYLPYKDEVGLSDPFAE